MQNTPFDLIQGDTWSLTISYTDADDNPIDISNNHIVAEVRDKPGGSILCGKVESLSGIELVDFPNTNNTIKVTFVPTQTIKFNLPKSYYQIKIIDTGDTLLTGWLNVEPGVING